MSSLLIKNGTVVTATDKFRGDVYIEGETVSQLGASLDLAAITPEALVAADPLFEEGLGLDSIDALELGMALQTEFGVSIDAEDKNTREHFRSVTNLARFVAAQQS